ncbi:hypothetical protein L873DRAFT_1804854 [Choiromyces venosus 120613-1]|uniref:Uncharacterized protein n=1 Tax=Choiromyces venosus 120613-1 TaxID=1336337 RepID=A0A3N4JU58_9PEZI|nr:hypothetical protein L873DRAFT_1804854 [Choiromyces venosus 120613-1]
MRFSPWEWWVQRSRIPSFRKSPSRILERISRSLYRFISRNRGSHTAGSDLGLVPRFIAVRCEASWFMI